jgi:DNA-binding MurR/RpiR family transcriptional regulator
VAGSSETAGLVSPVERFGASMAARPAATALQARIIERELANLTEAFEAVERDNSACLAADAIVGARRRFIAGAGKSAAYASLLDQDLSVGLSQVVLIDGAAVRPLDVLSDVRSTDVLVAFSMRRYRRETLELAELFVGRGGTLVAITDTETSPLLEHASRAVIVPTASASYTDSSTAVAAVIHLISALTTASAKGARRRLQERDRLAQELRLYR